MAEDYFLKKLLLVGDAGVGKSALLQRYTIDTFREEYVATIGVDFSIKKIEIDGKAVKLQIWDTAGQERFRTITTAYYRGAHGILIVYDVNDQESFNAVERWINDVERFAPEDIPLLIIGNKADLEQKREVDYATAKEFADEQKLDYIETSAKNSTNINDVFISISKKIINRSIQDGRTSLAKAKLHKKPDTNKKEHINKSRTCSLL